MEQCAVTQGQTTGTHSGGLLICAEGVPGSCAGGVPGSWAEGVLGSVQSVIIWRITGADHTPESVCEHDHLYPV